MKALTNFRVIHLVPLLIVAAIGGYFLWKKPESPIAAASGAGKGGVTEGKSYYVFVRALEVAPKKPSGAPWDRLADEAPDPYYEIHWRDNRIFASPTQRDQLLSQWSPLGVDTVKSITDGRIALHSVIKAASLRALDGETIELRVYDDDPVSQDTIAKLTLPLSDLREGENVFNYEQTDSNSVTHLQLAIIHADKPLIAQIDQILNR